MTLQFREERFYLFPLTLCVFELLCTPQISCALSSSFVHVDGKVSERPSRALRSLLARTALLARPYVAEGSITSLRPP